MSSTVTEAAWKGSFSAAPNGVWRQSSLLSLKRNTLQLRNECLVPIASWQELHIKAIHEPNMQVNHRNHSIKMYQNVSKVNDQRSPVTLSAPALSIIPESEVTSNSELLTCNL
jgi:hypothetical protein